MTIPKPYLLLTMLFFAFACKVQQKHTAAGGGSPQRVLQLKPGPNNPRNSEGSFISLKDGRILFVYSHYSGDKAGMDHDPAFLAGRYSSDGGKTWTSQDEVIVENEGEMNVMSVSLLRLQNGDIALFYLVKNSVSDCMPVMRISRDEAKTWSAPRLCTPDRVGYYVLNNDRVIQLSSGRLLMALALHKTPTTQWSGKASLWSYFSDDNGQTWQRGGQVPTPEKVITQEPGVVELQEGKVMMFIRASAGSQLVSYSQDKGLSWSMAQASNIPSPLSPASIKRIPQTGDLLLVWNNNDGSRPEIKGKRTPLSLAVSRNEGKTWQYLKTIEDNPDGWYCYIAIHFTRRDVLLSYCAGTQGRDTGLAQTDITRIPLTSIYP